MLVGITEARADEPYLGEANENYTTMTYSARRVSIGQIYLSRYSYWYDDPVLYVDDIKVATFKDLGIPTLSAHGGDKQKLFQQLEAILPNNGRYKTYNPPNNMWTSVLLHDPAFNGHNVSVDITVHTGWQQQGKNHTIKIVGKWVNNDGHPTQKELQWTTSSASINNVFPSTVKVERIGNGKVKVTWNGLGTRPNHTNDICVYPANKVPNMTQGVHSNLVTKVTPTQPNGTHEFKYSNYWALWMYPRVHHSTSYSTAFGRENRVYFNDYGRQIIRGFARANALKVSTLNTYSRKIKLTWVAQVADPDYADTNGKWYIFRRKKGDENMANTEKLAALPYETREHELTLENNNYDIEYKYIVCFVPNGWTANSEADATDLSSSAEHRLHRDFRIDALTTTATSSAITLNWSHTSLVDASNSNRYTLKVERSTDRTQWNEIAQVHVENPEIREGNYVDSQNLQAWQVYYYRLKVFVQGKEYSLDADGTLDGSTKVTAFTASRGVYNNTVKLQWEVDQVGSSSTYFNIQRRLLGSTSESDWINIHSTQGVASIYAYDDITAKPGSFYEYRIKCWGMHNDQRMGERNTDSDGFALSTGVLSGRIFYESGTAVEGAKVVLRPSNNEGAQAGLFRSLKLVGGRSGSGMLYSGDNETFKRMVGSDYSIQLFLNPDNTVMNSTEHDYLLVDVEYQHFFWLKYDPAAGGYRVGVLSGKGITAYANDLLIPANQWSHLTMVYSKEKQEVRFYLTKLGEQVASEPIPSIVNPAVEHSQRIALGNDITLPPSDLSYAGYVDEFRLFSKALTPEEIQRNYNHPLTGTEDKLEIYWPMDEKLGLQTIAYDFSRTNGIINGRYATMNVAAQSSDFVPEETEFSLCGYTDAEGNYVINGVPFSGEGMNYSVVPMMGTHEFSPSASSRYFSHNSLVHSGLDFKDISSFPVEGHVYYENTTIPVEEAYVYIDGVIASKDGEAVMTDANGYYKVDVPIGDHFLQIKKNKHNFVGNGRYPEDPNGVGTRHTFDRPISGLTFYDNTKVVVAGRVAGGSLEEKKLLGLQQGTANIGRAKITLTFPGSENRLINAQRRVEGAAVSYVASDVRRNFDTPSTGAKAYVAANSNEITIETDSLTGEFSALVPPLRYDATAILVPTQPEIDFSNKLPILDASNTGLEYTDSLLVDGKMKKFVYAAAAKVIYRSPSVLEITENADGSFGMAEAKVADVSGNIENVRLYTRDEDGTIHYTFGAPVYQSLSRYTYKLYAYERYTNKDVAASPVTLEVPIPFIDVTIKNQMASTTTVKASDGTVGEVKDNTFKLDSIGRATYSFYCGLPNIQQPYTRTLSASYTVNGVNHTWAGNNITWNNNHAFTGVVLGSLTTGNNFVTEGPDEVQMVLRDPPGSLSKTTYGVGTEVTKVQTYSDLSGEVANTQIDVSMGCEMQTGGGFGFIALTEFSISGTLTAGASVTQTRNSINQTTTTTTTTQEISTSDGTDFVGADGDVYIGISKNLVFGGANQVKIVKNASNNQYELTMAPCIAMGEQFKTSFNYTQYYVQNVLIPNYQSLRNQMLTQVADVNSVAPPTGQDPIYVTTLSPDDPRFGSDNDDTKVWGEQAKRIKVQDNRIVGPSYTVIFPNNFIGQKSWHNKVKYYNQQVRKWQHQIMLNEKAKLQAINDRRTYLDKNYSFDAGAIVASSTTSMRATEVVDEFTSDAEVVIGGSEGFSFNGNGVNVSFTKSNSFSISESTTSGQSETTSIGWILQEDGDDDYLTVDVFKAPDCHGPIFVTRAGATSAPYEGEVLTQFYDPGKVISHKTMQIEKPEIEILDAIVTGVPGGKDAKFRVALRNNSETREDCYYGLRVEGNSNANGAQVFVDGQNLGSRPSLLIPYGETIKTFSLRQTNTDVVDYEDVQITLFSLSQPDDTGTVPGIYSTGQVSVHFQPACSDISLASNATLVNTERRDPVILSMSDYDYTMESFRDVRLQYKGLHDAEWRTLQEYTKDAARLQANVALRELPALTGTNKLTFALDLNDASYTDQTYLFRALAVCIRGNEEITRSSEELQIVRDLSKPQLLSTPTPQSGVLYPGDDISITFNEPIRSELLSQLSNFSVVGVKNQSRVAHQVALKVSDQAVRTEAPIHLENQSFGLGMWVNYTTDGTLLVHGAKDQSMQVATADGKLTVRLNGNTLQAEKPLPKNKWLYLMMLVDLTAERPHLIARYADDASSTDLLNQEIAGYPINGRLAIGGEGMNGAVQELTLWKDVRTLDELQAQMHQKKTAYTDKLMGYWRFDEGHGTLATDHVRNRHFVLEAENGWWKNFTNYALATGSNGAKADVSTLGLRGTDDFVIEAWVMASSEQPEGDVYVMANPPSQLAWRIDAQRKLQMDYSGQSVQITDQSFCDNQWHHLALSVNHSTNGYAKVYVDGKLRAQVPAKNVSVPHGEYLLLGAPVPSQTNNSMKGFIDEVRIWKGQRSENVIADWRYQRANGQEAQLALHLPFEQLSVDAYGQPQTVASLANSIDSKVLAVGGTGELTTTSEKVPALNPAATLENIAYSFVANNNQITFRLEEQPAVIEGCTIQFSAHNIKDQNGNSNVPVTWNVLVRRGNLKWETESLEATQAYGETKVFKADISNAGIVTENWVLNGLPTWLNVSSESGTLPALKNATLTFIPEKGLAVGKYQATLLLTGSQGIELPLNISLTVKGKVPEWKSVPDETNMNIVGQLKLNGIFSSDPDDILAAFRGDKCVGVAQPKYVAKYDAYLIMMDLYGNESEVNNVLTYKIYDASTGKIYPLISANDNKVHTFKADTWVGSFEQPVSFWPENKIEQVISTNDQGWRWFSLYAQPSDNKPSAIFEQSKSSIAILKDAEQATYYQNETWTGNLQQLSYHKMYKVKSTASIREAFVGAPAEEANVSLTLNHGWNWIGYPVSWANSLNDAFAGAQPKEGDMVKGQSGFALYNDNQWIGSLSMMTPGEGYQYYSNDAGSKSFQYPKVKATTQKRTSPLAANSFELDFENNMTMVAQVKNGHFAIDGAVVSVYADGELCGRAEAPIADGKFFITMGGNRKTNVTFVVETPSNNVQLVQQLTFEADKHFGTLDNPYVLQMDKLTVIQEIKNEMSNVDRVEVFDVSGRLVKHWAPVTDTDIFDSSHYLESNYYIFRLTYKSGEVKTLKLLM